MSERTTAQRAILATFGDGRRLTIDDVIGRVRVGRPELSAALVRSRILPLVLTGYLEFTLDRHLLRRSGGCSICFDQKLTRTGSIQEPQVLNKKDLRI